MILIVPHTAAVNTHPEDSYVACIAADAFAWLARNSPDRKLHHAQALDCIATMCALGNIRLAANEEGWAWV